MCPLTEVGLPKSRSGAQSGNNRDGLLGTEVALTWSQRLGGGIACMLSCVWLCQVVFRYFVSHTVSVLCRWWYVFLGVFKSPYLELGFQYCCRFPSSYAWSPFSGMCHYTGTPCPRPPPAFFQGPQCTELSQSYSWDCDTQLLSGRRALLFCSISFYFFPF